MITGITIENFKGIGDRVELEVRPITLLFGLTQHFLLLPRRAWEPDKIYFRKQTN